MKNFITTADMVFAVIIGIIIFIGAALVFMAITRQPDNVISGTPAEDGYIRFGPQRTIDQPAKIIYKNHYYIRFETGITGSSEYGGVGVVHDPDCPCYGNGEE